MRTIHKAQAPPILQREQQKTPPSSAREAETRWKRFRKTHGKTEIRACLLEEQWWLCGYTELSLTDFEHGFHIEHIHPKSTYPPGTFDYHNLVISALDSDALKSFPKLDRFGGHFKQSHYDAKLFVSPVLPDSQRYFEYLSNGRVEPAFKLSTEEQKRARYTIDLLNLNSPYLVNARRKWLMEIEDEIDRLLDNIPALKILAECELCDTNGRLRQFHTAARERFGHLGNQMMKNACPKCLGINEV